MKKLKFLLYVMMGILPIIGVAQENGVFTVSGTALKTVNPTELMITAGVTWEGNNAQDVYETVNGVMTKAIAMVKNKKGIKRYETDIVRMNNAFGKSTSVRYSATQTITIAITNFDIYDEVMLKLFELGFNNIQNVSFTVDNMAELKHQVQLEAIAAAKKKAKEFSGALGVNLGQVLSFNEQNYATRYANTANYNAMDAAVETGPSIAPNQVEIMMTVIVSFAINKEENN